MWVVGHCNVFYVGQYPNATFRSYHSFMKAMLCYECVESQIKLQIKHDKIQNYIHAGSMVGAWHA